MVHVDAKFLGESRFLKILGEMARFSLFYNKTFPKKVFFFVKNYSLLKAHKPPWPWKLLHFKDTQLFPLKMLL